MDKVPFTSFGEIMSYYGEVDPNKLDCIQAAHDIAEMVTSLGFKDSEILIIYSPEGYMHPNPDELNFESESGAVEDWRLHVAVKLKDRVIDPLAKGIIIRKDFSTYINNLLPAAVGNGKLFVFSMPADCFEFLTAPQESYSEINSATAFIGQMMNAGLLEERTKTFEV